MPQVPYSGVPEVSPQGGSLPQAHVEATPAAFGGGVAQAVSHVGEVAEGAGKELFARAVAFQEMGQQVKADVAATDTTDKQTQLYLDYSKKKGNELVDANPEFNEKLEKIRTDNAAELDSPYAKQRYLQESRRGQSQMIWHGAVLARNGQETAAEAALAGKANAVAQRYSTLDPNDEKSWNEVVSTSKQIFADQVHQKTGFAPGSKENDEGVAPLLSKQISKMLVAKSNSDHPEIAKQLFDKAKADGSLTPEDSDALEQRIENVINNKLATKTGATIGADPANKHKTPLEVEELARKEAERIVPGNKTFADNAANAADARQTHQKNLEDASWRETQNTLIDGVNGKTTEGRVTRTFEEASQDPVWRDKFNSLPEKQQVEVKEKFLELGKTSGWIENEKGNDEFANLHFALADSHASPQDVEDALRANLFKTHMTMKQINDIRTLQSNVLGSQTKDSAITKALKLSVVQTQVEEAQLDPKSAEYKDFSRKFSEAAKEYVAGNNGLLDEKKLGEVAKQLLMHQTKTWAQTLTLQSDPKAAYKNFFEAHPEIAVMAMKSYKDGHGKDAKPTEAEWSMIAQGYFNEYFRTLGQKAKPPASKSINRVVPKAGSAGE